jgi:DNA polymerase III delta prime subunit
LISVMEKKAPSMDLPNGWVLINEEFLKPYQDELSADEALSYFDGLSPTWQEALSNNVPQRSVVRELCGSLDEARRVKRRQVTLLLGAGGEGKSTVLRQVIINLFRSSSYQNILWHEDVNTPLEKSFINDLISNRESWLITSDEADRIGRDVYDAVCLLREKSKNNVQFLLCCRDTDWKGEHADELNWREKVFFDPRTMRGLTIEDANLVIDAWKQYGDKGLGKLAGLDTFEAASRLVEHAKSEARSNIAEGSFLGAMLRVRLGEAIQDHVKNLLTRLDSRKIPDGSLTLMDAFASIVALHAENIQLLTKSVLAQSLSCPLDQAQRRILGPLGEEAAISEYASYVLTRHRAIAEVAKNILTQTFNIDFDEVYIKLLRGAMAAYFSDELEVDPTYWNQLPSTVFDRGKPNLGIRLAKTLVAVEPNNPFHVVGLSKLYRRNRQSQRAAEAFREAFSKVIPDRAFYHEWSTSEGYDNKHYLSAWLDGVSLADGLSNERVDERRIPISLSGLATSFGKLFDKGHNRRFIEACAAASQLGLRSNPDEKTKGKLLFNKTNSNDAGIGDMELNEAFDKVVTGIKLAWELRYEDDEREISIKPADQLTFHALAKQLGLRKG